jgi:hypothetical protein
MATKEVTIAGQDLPIKRFELQWMEKNPAICMIAKRGSGKSWVCRDILRNFHDIPGGVIISPTDKLSRFYGDFFPDLYIHYAYSADVLDNIFYRQEKILEKVDDLKKKGKKIDPRIFLLMDDCLSSKTTWMKEQQIQKIFFDGRHYKIMFILTMQFPLGITPDLRSNFDYIFLLGEDFKSNQKRLYDHYAGMFPSLKAFIDVFEQVTNDYGSMVIVNRGARHSFLEKIFWYKATDQDIHPIGCKQFRVIHDKNYNNEWKKKDKGITVDQFMRNKIKNKDQVKINKIGMTEVH